MLKPTLASVIVLRMPDFARRSVREQTRLKGDLETLVALAIRPLAAGDRIILETSDGVVIAVLGGPYAALEMAERAQAANPSLCIGANHGAIRKASDALRGPGLMGDGIAAGVIVASAATPGRLLVSRAFRDALEAHAPTHAACLSAVGTFTDPDVRTHELFAVDRLALHARNRRRFVVGASFTAAIAGLGLSTWVFLRKEAVRPAIVVFEIAPRGDVVVDGVVKGKSPPLTHLELIPGPHNIEVRNAGFPPLYLNVELGSPKYMSPEQVAGRRVDHRSDVFSLGIVLYEAITGTAPFQAPDMGQLIYRIANVPHCPPSTADPALPPMLDLIVAKALEKTVDARYQSAADLAADLRACITAIEAMRRAYRVDSTEATVMTTTDAAASAMGIDLEIAITGTSASGGAPNAGYTTTIINTGVRGFFPLSRQFDSNVAMQRLKQWEAAGTELEPVAP